MADELFQDFMEMDEATLLIIIAELRMEAEKRNIPIPSNHTASESLSVNPMVSNEALLAANSSASVETATPSSSANHTVPNVDQESIEEDGIASQNTVHNVYTSKSTQRCSTPSTVSYNFDVFAENDEFEKEKTQSHMVNSPPPTSASSFHGTSSFASGFGASSRTESPRSFSTSSKPLPRIRLSLSTSESIISDDSFMGQNPPKVRTGSLAYEKDTAMKFSQYEPVAEDSMILTEPAISTYGSQRNKTCACNEIVQTITVKDSHVTCLLTDHKEVGPITNFASFFDHYIPAHALTINSEHFQTFGNFVNSCLDVQYWARETRMVTVTGEYSAEMLKQLAASFGHVEIFQLHRFQIFQDEFFLDEFLALIPKVFQITVDARFFTRSNYHSDFKYAASFLQSNAVYDRSLTVITTKMVDPARLQHNLRLAEMRIPARQRLNFITENECYKEISTTLTTQLKFNHGSGNIRMKHYENLIYLTFYKKYGTCEIILGFSTADDN